MIQILESQDTSYRALAGDLWGVFCEDFGETDRVITAPRRIMFKDNFTQESILFFNYHDLTAIVARISDHNPSFLYMMQLLTRVLTSMSV